MLELQEMPARPVKHPDAKARRDAIKAAGGAEYEALLEKERVQRIQFRERRVGRMAELRRRWKKKYGKNFKSSLCMKARRRGRDNGLESTIRAEDLDWPSHCPVLGIELDYPDRAGLGLRKGQTNQPNWPSLDRWDNTKGYVPGNVFVISLRANVLKGDATYEEILRVARYMARKP